MLTKRKQIAISSLFLLIMISWQLVLFTHTHKEVPFCELSEQGNVSNEHHFHPIIANDCSQCYIVSHSPLCLPIQIGIARSAIFTLINYSINIYQKNKQFPLVMNSRGPPFHSCLIPQQILLFKSSKSKQHETLSD